LVRRAASTATHRNAPAILDAPLGRSETADRVTVCCEEGSVPRGCRAGTAQRDATDASPEIKVPTEAVLQTKTEGGSGKRSDVPLPRNATQSVPLNVEVPVGTVAHVECVSVCFGLCHRKRA
jgi:hypothetical protein